MALGLPAALAVLVAPAVLALVLVYVRRLRRGAIASYEDRGGAGSLVRHVSSKRETARAVLLIAGATATAIAAARPQWGSEPQLLVRDGTDVAVVLDVSVSMLAQDVAPSRLERAKAEAHDLVQSLRGDRVGLAIFAKTAYQRFPLTTDLALASSLIDGVTIEPREVEPGTALEAGLRAGLDLLSSSTSPTKAVVIISDGEDLTGAQIQATQDAIARGVHIFALGIGGSGATIPVSEPGTNRVVQKTDPRTGAPVVTRLVEDGLRVAAAATGGVFSAVTPGGGSIASITSAVDGLEGAAGQTEQQDRPIERFQVFVALGLALLVAQLLIGAAPRRLIPSWRRLRLSPIAAGLLLTGCAAGVGLVNDRANTLFDRGRYRDALERYREVQSERPDLLEVHYNIGTTLYKLGDYSRAVEELQRAVQSTDASLAERSLYSLGNAYVRMGRLDDAVRSYRAALKLDPGDEDAKFNLEVIQARITPTPSTTPSTTPTGSPTSGPTASATPGPSTTATGTGTPESTGTPEGTGTPDGTGTPGTATPGPNATDTPDSGTGTPASTETPGPGGTGTPDVNTTREPGEPELPDDSPNSEDQERATEEQLRELLRALDDPDLSPEDALRILDAYRAAQAARESGREPGPIDGGADDW